MDKEIKTIADKLHIPVEYVEQAIKEAQRNYWMSNSEGKTPAILKSSGTGLSESIFGIPGLF